MTPRSRLIAAAAAIEPARQGDVDALCSLYSIINALQIALYPVAELRAAQRRKLFAHGIQLIGDPLVSHELLLRGVSNLTWRRIAKSLTCEVGQWTGITLRCSFILNTVPQSSWAYTRAVKASLHRGHPVLLELLGAYDHFTVAVAYSRHRITLSDSVGFRWIDTRSIGPCASLEYRHRLRRFGAMAIIN